MADVPVSDIIGANLLKWRRTVADEDLTAAHNYLSIKVGDADATKTIARLRDENVTTRRANDILRAVGRPALPMTDPGVLGALRDVLQGEALSPVIVGDGDILDGYHRVCLAFNLDPFDDVVLVMV